jgi:hypothetical protein
VSALTYGSIDHVRLRRARMYFSFQPIPESLFRHLQVIVSLQVHPGLWIDPEVTPQAQRGVCRDHPFPVDDFIDPPRGNSYSPGKGILAECHGLQEVFHQYFTGVNRR